MGHRNPPWYSLSGPAGSVGRGRAAYSRGTHAVPRRLLFRDGFKATHERVLGDLVSVVFVSPEFGAVHDLCASSRSKHLVLGMAAMLP